MSAPEAQPMKSWFTLGCRLFGLWVLFHTAEYVITALDMILGVYRPMNGTTFFGTIVHAIFFFAFSMCLMVAAPLIADIFYPNESDREKIDQSDGPPPPTP